MTPEFVQRPSLLLAGVTDCGKDVTEIDIHGLWDVYMRSEPQIPHRIDGCWYELHVGGEQGHGIYSVTAGAEVSEIGALPVEVSVRVVPAGQYAHFAHCMRDGGFREVFARIDAWVKQSGSQAKGFGLQLFDRDFDLANESSILHIYVPMA